MVIPTWESTNLGFIRDTTTCFRRCIRLLGMQQGCGNGTDRQQGQNGVALWGANRLASCVTECTGPMLFYIFLTSIRNVLLPCTNDMSPARTNDSVDNVHPVVCHATDRRTHSGSNS